MRCSWLLAGCLLAVALLLTGCRHAPVKAASAPVPPKADSGPVMVSVPPPTHRSNAIPENAINQSNIPVVEAIPQRKRTPRRKPPVIATAVPPQATLPLPPVPPTQPAATSLGQLTAATENNGTTRADAEQALRTQRDRISALPANVQSAHPAEVDQARRFLKTAADSWTAGDYTAALTLATKAKVLLDDLQK